jgi:hypothetical protein
MDSLHVVNELDVRAHEGATRLDVIDRVLLREAL